MQWPSIGDLIGRPRMKTRKRKPVLPQNLTRPFMAGLVALFPLALTIAVIVWLGTMIHGYLGPRSSVGGFLRKIGLNFVTSDAAAYLIGAVTVLGLIYLLGILVEAGMKSRWQALTDHALTRIPLVSTIYDAAKKIAMMVEPGDNEEMKSMTPVLCSFGGSTGTTIPAFMPSPEILKIDGRDYRVVVIPTAPVPFGGAIMCVPAEWVKLLDCGIEGLFNIYMSMGVTMKEYFSEGDDVQGDVEVKRDNGAVS
jgi:uncharacterized membrane protein